MWHLNFEPDIVVRYWFSIVTTAIHFRLSLVLVSALCQKYISLSAGVWGEASATDRYIWGVVRTFRTHCMQWKLWRFSQDRCWGWTVTYSHCKKKCLAAEAEQLQQLCEQAIADLHDERTWAREGITSLEHRVQDLTQGQEAAQDMIKYWKREAEKLADSGQWAWSWYWGSGSPSTKSRVLVNF